MILGGAALVAQFELFQTEHRLASSPRQPVGRAASQATQADDDVLKLACHAPHLCYFTSWPLP